MLIYNEIKYKCLDCDQVFIVDNPTVYCDDCRGTNLKSIDYETKNKKRE